MKKISPLEKTWLEVNLEKYGWLCCTTNHFSAHNQAHDNKVPFFLLKYSEKYGFGECTLLPGKILRAAENLRQRNIMNNTWKQRGWWWKGRIGDILFWTFLISGKSNSLLQRWKWKWRLLILKRYCLLALPLPFCSEMKFDVGSFEGEMGKWMLYPWGDFIFWLFLRLSWLWQSNLEILFASSSPFSICGKSNYFLSQWLYFCF